mmetsp:Transcript_35059/g.99384  ORF Transcript_35059/g.99384 Transcript_35059/m.99384 type:complete len:329 (+) Transcript_35059:2833-3819(+)
MLHAEQPLRFALRHAAAAVLAAATNGHLPLGRGLTSEDSLFADAGALQEEAVRRDNVLSLVKPRRADNGNDVTRQQALARQPLPLAAAVHLNELLGGLQGTELVEVPQPCLHHRGLEHHQHQQREKGVVHILIHAPEQDTEDLEHEEGRQHLVLKELVEGGHRHLEGVGAPELQRVRHLGGVAIAGALGPGGERLLGGVLEAAPGTLLRAVHKADLSVFKGHSAGAVLTRLSGHEDRTELCVPIILVGHRLDNGGILKRGKAGECHVAADADQPLLKQQQKDVANGCEQQAGQRHLEVEPEPPHPGGDSGGHEERIECREGRDVEAEG